MQSLSLHEQTKRGIYNYWICTRLLHVCLTVLVLEESISLVTLVHVLSLTMTKVSKRNIHQSFEHCRQTFEDNKLTFIYALLNANVDLLLTDMYVHVFSTYALLYTVLWLRTYVYTYLHTLTHTYEIIIFSVLAVEVTSFGNRGVEVLVISFRSSAISTIISGIKTSVKSLSSPTNIFSTRVSNSSALISNLICSTVLHSVTSGDSHTPFWLHCLVAIPKVHAKYDYKLQ